MAEQAEQLDETVVAFHQRLLGSKRIGWPADDASDAIGTLATQQWALSFMHAAGVRPSVVDGTDLEIDDWNTAVVYAISDKQTTNEFISRDIKHLDFPEDKKISGIHVVLDHRVHWRMKFEEQVQGGEHQVKRRKTREMASKASDPFETHTCYEIGVRREAGSDVYFTLAHAMALRVTILFLQEEDMVEDAEDVPNPTVLKDDAFQIVEVRVDAMFLSPELLCYMQVCAFRQFRLFRVLRNGDAFRKVIISWYFCALLTGHSLRECA